MMNHRRPGDIARRSARVLAGRAIRRGVDAFRRDEGLVLTDIDYADVPGLSNEARSKLEAARPRTVGQAGRLDGMTPAALAILAAYLRREARKATAALTA